MYGHSSKSLVIITTMLLLKTTSHKTSFVTLKRTIGASLNLVDPLTSDGTDSGRKRNKIPGTSAFKSSNLLCHRKLPFRMNNSLTVRSRLKNSSTSGGKSKAINRRTRTRTQAISRLRGRGRLIQGSIHRSWTTSVMLRKRGNNRRRNRQGRIGGWRRRSHRR